MIKIQMAVEITEDAPQGKSQEFIWMLGQSWPVPMDKDARIIRLEAFGTELDTIGPRFSGGESITNEVTKRDVCRTWYGNDARYLSEQMRIFYP
jgi:hypothetical protein